MLEAEAGSKRTASGGTKPQRRGQKCTALHRCYKGHSLGSWPCRKGAALRIPGQSNSGRAAFLHPSAQRSASTRCPHLLSGMIPHRVGFLGDRKLYLLMGPKTHGSNVTHSPSTAHLLGRPETEGTWDPGLVNHLSVHPRTRGPPMHRQNQGSFLRRVLWATREIQRGLQYTQLTCAGALTSGRLITCLPQPVGFSSRKNSNSE